MSYSSYVFNTSPLWEHTETARLSFFLWEREGFSRPESFVKLCAVKDKGIFARMWSFEDNLRCVFSVRDDPVYKDSCCEFFLAPVSGDPRYMNFEINPCGAFLSQIGPVRENRVFIKEITKLAPEVTPFSITENGKTAWGCEIFIPDALISELYGCNFRSQECEMKGNFYKCAEDSLSPHYGAFFPVGSATPDFHRPEFFGRIILRNFEGCAIL